MTNTTFRKRALLSSVAMMLVALIALGSATFAWFSTTPTASASGLTMTTTAKDGLLVKAEGGNQQFANSTTLGLVENPDYATDNTQDQYIAGSFDLVPASFTGTFTTEGGKYLPVFAKTESSDPEHFVGDGNNPALAPGTASYSEKVYVKTISKDSNVFVSGITLTAAEDNSVVNNQDIFNAVRVLVVDADSAKVLAHTGPIANTNKNLLKTDGYRDDVADDGPPETTQGLSTTAYSYVAPGTASANQLSGTVTTGTGRYVIVYVYLDGEDSHVTSAAVSSEDILSNITITFSLPTT